MREWKEEKRDHATNVGGGGGGTNRRADGRMDGGVDERTTG